MSASSSGVSSGKSGWGLSRILSVVGLVAALIYIIAMWVNLPVVELITKGIPVLCLIVWLFKLPRDRFAMLIMAGLIVSLVADLVMQWDRSLFLPGLLIFLVAQLIYIAAFVSMSQRGSWVRLLPFVVWGVIAFLILNPYLADLLLPVAVYMVAIVVMMWRAAALVGAHGRVETFELVALVGALAFGLSDTLLAFNRFIWHGTLTMFSIQESAPFISTLVIVLYWLGQLGIALAAGWEAKDRARGVTAK
jgi:alkenylglycerophosphocholine/alkenylglycerophosphoethanolamine hydrolase